MEMLCDWNSYVAFHVGKVQATCSISSVVDLQNLLGTTLVLRVVPNKSTPPSSLLSIQPKSQTSTLTLSLHIHVQQCCQAGYNLAYDKIIYVWDVQRRTLAGNQSWEREEETAGDSRLEVALASRARSSFEHLFSDD